MKYFSDLKYRNFVVEPCVFDKNTDKAVLKYCLGANLYMPANIDNLCDRILYNRLGGVGSITLCLEDAIKGEDVSDAEDKLIETLIEIYKSEDLRESGRMPLIFIRVRKFFEFRALCNKILQRKDVSFLQVVCGFVFPKIRIYNAVDYFELLKDFSSRTCEILYAMPILESTYIADKSNRMAELDRLKDIFNKFSDYILNIRVGGTDLSSYFRLRRDVHHTIWDLRNVADCIVDILNVFSNKFDDYVVSGPVWEYFSLDKESEEIVGLQKELDIDMQNGLQGKTAVHPDQVPIINESYIVSYSDYFAAKKIKELKGGVANGNGNSMLEKSPHEAWADVILSRAKVFGVSM